MLPQSGYLPDALAVKNQFNELNESLTNGYVPKNVASNTNNTVDPNTTLLPVVRTKHANCPVSNGTFIIYTSVTDTDTEKAERCQFAVNAATNTPDIYVRSKPWDSSWGTWRKIAYE